MLFTIDFDEYFIDVEGVALASVLPFQSPSVESAEFDTPESDRFPRDNDAPLSKQILGITMT
jgi:hypothetical protein